MATFRCPKHDVLFQANQPPTQDGHKKCPICNPPEKPKPGENPEPAEAKQQAGVD